MASTYSTWDYYRDEYRGALDEGDYTREAIKAAGEIDRRTFGRAKSAPATMAAAIQNCECELVDALYSFEQSYEALPKGLSSLNNDGLSAVSSYGSSMRNSRETAQSAEIRDICQKYLLDPINLMFAGVY